MVTANPKLPAWIEAEIKFLATLTANHNVEKLRQRRSRPNGVNVDIYHHSAGTDSYFCDVRKKYLRWKEVMSEADSKVACGQYLFTSVIEHKAGVHFISSQTMPDPSHN